MEQHGTDTSHPDLALRRRPVQARSRERVALILRTGRDQLATVGLERFTFEGIAAAAGIPIGSIYQFFPNKYALISELSEEDTADLIEQLGAAADQFPSDDWQSDVDRLIDRFAVMWRSEPGRRHVWLAMQSTGATRALAAEQTGRVVEKVTPLIEFLLPDGNSRRAKLVGEVVVQMCYSLLHFSVRDDRPHRATVEELKRALRSYLRSVALDANA